MEDVPKDVLARNWHGVVDHKEARISMGCRELRCKICK